MKVLVTGREGQLVRSLLERGEGQPGLELIAVGRPDIDLEVPGSAERAVKAIAPDVIINAAAYTAVDQAEDEPERAFRVNGEAAGELAAAAHRAGARIIQISTNYVFDGTSPEPYNESSPVNPISVYGRSKLLGEQHVREADPDHVIVRTAWVYSPFGRNFVKTMLTRAETLEEVSVVSDQRGNPTSALDLADGLLALAAHWRATPRLGLGRTYHLAGRGETSWSEFAAGIFEAGAPLGLPVAKVRSVKASSWPAKASRPSYSALDASAFEADMRFTMPHWQSSAEVVVGRLATAAFAGS